MPKYQTLKRSILRSVVGTTAIALALCSAATILVVRSKNQGLVLRETSLRTIRASEFINPTLLSRVEKASIAAIGDNPAYLDLAEDLAAAVQAIPESSADLYFIDRKSDDTNSRNPQDYDCWYVLSISSLGLLASEHSFKHPISCPQAAIDSLGFKEVGIQQNAQKFGVTKNLTVYRPIKNGINTVGIIAINFDVKRVTDVEIETFYTILLLQTPIVAVVAIALKYSLKRKLDRLTAIVGACQDLASGNYALVDQVPSSMMNLDEIGILAVELKAAAARLQTERVAVKPKSDTPVQTND